MRRSGLTIIELLLALVLLAALTSGLAVWVNVAADLRVSVQEHLTWSQNAEAALRVIEDDLSSGDLAPIHEEAHASHTIPRVRALDDRLMIVAREAGTGAITSVYELANDTWLWRSTISQAGVEIGRDRWLVGDLTGFECILKADDETDTLVLHVTLHSASGESLTRRFVLP